MRRVLVAAAWFATAACRAGAHGETTDVAASHMGARAGSAPALPSRAPLRARADCAPEADGQPEPFHVVVGGDLMLHPQIMSVAEEHAAAGDPASGYAWLLREIAPVKRRLGALGRIVFVANQESPVATQRVETTHWPPRFNGPPEALAGWRAAGIDVVTLANNHAYDQRREGLAETIAAARAAGLRTAGAGDAAEARAPVALSERAPRVLLLDYLWTPERMPDPPDETAARIAVLDDRTAAEVRAAADDSDVLLVVVHWIGEFQARPIDAWREWTRRIAGSGADAIVCHGPHVVGPLETIDAGGRAVPVAFSLGNLVANMGWGVHPGVELPPSSDSEFRIETREEALAVLRIDPPAPGAGTGAAWAVGGLWIVPLWLEDNRPLAGGPHGPRREIFPRPMPWCAAPPETGCFEGASDAWCAGRREMIAERRDALLRTIWNAPPQPLPPCPAGADPYDPPPDFRTFGLAGAGGGP